MRLGCEVEASDLNPVAVLILKGTLEYPQKYGQPDSRPVPAYIHQAAAGNPQSGFTDGDPALAYRRNPLAADVRYWGHWMLERAREELAEFYPPDPTAACRWPTCGAAPSPAPTAAPRCPSSASTGSPARTSKKVALEPVLDRENNRVDFKVVEGPNVTGDPADGHHLPRRHQVPALRAGGEGSANP